MSPRAIELALRRQSLQQRAAQQRGELAVQVTTLAPLFSAADAVRSGVVWMKRHPEWVAGAVALVMIVRPRVVFRWAHRAFILWQGARESRRYLESLIATGRRA